MPGATETSFKTLVDVPVHYDRLPPPLGYGSKGKSRNFECRHKLKRGLEECFKELFEIWGRDTPSIILSAGTIGDGENAHGQGFAFDLDGFYWGDMKFMMINFPADREFYLGINAHLFHISLRCSAITIRTTGTISMSISISPPSFAPN